jgi:hypothetical protein
MQYNIVAFLLVKTLAFPVVTTIMSLLFITLYI